MYLPKITNHSSAKSKVNSEPQHVQDLLPLGLRLLQQCHHYLLVVHANATFLQHVDILPDVNELLSALLAQPVAGLCEASCDSGE